MSGLLAGGASRRRSVGDSTKDRRPRLKSLAAESAQERRRQEFISNQKRARRNLSDHARLLAALPSEESEVNDADADAAEHENQYHYHYQHQHHYQQQEHQGFPAGGAACAGAGAGAGGVVVWGGQDGGGGAGEGQADAEAEEDGMAVDCGDGQARDATVRPAVGSIAEHDGASKTVPASAPAGAGELDTSGPVSSSGSNRSHGGGTHSHGHGNGGAAKGKRGAGGGGSSGAAQRAVKRRDHWANQLCTPEWMLTVPNDLNGAGSRVGGGWYVMARPEGKRVLLIAAKGETVARQMSGAVTHRFSSNLPGGSAQGRRGGAKGGGYCILDCVFHELDQTFFVLDMMAWKGYPLYDCNTDFRLYWVRTKLLEADGPLDSVTSRNAYRIKPTPYHECDRQGLAHAYSSPVPFIKDGLLFHLKSAHYQLGPTPLVLLWKDASVARYLGVDSAQAVVLKVGDRRCKEEQPTECGETSTVYDQGANPAAAGGVQRRGFAASSGNSEHGDAASHPYPLLTADGVWVGEVGAEGSAAYIPQAKPNDLLRFELTGVEEELVDVDIDVEVDRPDGGTTMMRGVVHGLRFAKRCSKLRPMADTWSKLLFQARLRLNGGVSVDDIDSKCLATAAAATATAAATAGVAKKTEPLSTSGFEGVFGSSQAKRAAGQAAAATSPVDDDEML